MLGYIGSHAIRFNYKLESINLKGDYGFCRSSVVNNGENVKEIKLWGRFTEYEEGPEKAFYDAFADLMSKRSEVDLKSPCPYCKVKHEYSTKIYINKIYIERALKYAESGNDILRTLEKFKKNCFLGRLGGYNILKLMIYCCDINRFSVEEEVYRCDGHNDNNEYKNIECHEP